MFTAIAKSQFCLFLEQLNTWLYCLWVLANGMLYRAHRGVHLTTEGCPFVLEEEAVFWFWFLGRSGTRFIPATRIPARLPLNIWQLCDTLISATPGALVPPSLPFPWYGLDIDKLTAAMGHFNPILLPCQQQTEWWNNQFRAYLGFSGAAHVMSCSGHGLTLCQSSSTWMIAYFLLLFGFCLRVFKNLVFKLQNHDTNVSVWVNKISIRGENLQMVAFKEKCYIFGEMGMRA